MAVGVIPIRLWVGEIVGDQPGETGQCIRGAVHGICDHRQRSTQHPTSNFNNDMLMFSARATISTRRTSERRSADLPPAWLSRAMDIHRLQQQHQGMEKSTL